MRKVRSRLAAAVIILLAVTACSSTDDGAQSACRGGSGDCQERASPGGA